MCTAVAVAEAVAVTPALAVFVLELALALAFVRVLFLVVSLVDLCLSALRLSKPLALLQKVWQCPDGDAGE